MADGAPIESQIIRGLGNVINKVAVLRIYPGAVVAFDGGKSLTIGQDGNDKIGALQADGVTFTAVEQDTQGWTQIYFHRETNDDPTNSLMVAL